MFVEVTRENAKYKSSRILQVFAVGLISFSQKHLSRERSLGGQKKPDNLRELTSIKQLDSSHVYTFNRLIYARRAHYLLVSSYLIRRALVA
jgi:hypothetical protein